MGHPKVEEEPGALISMNTNDLMTIRAMGERGGSFVQAMAHAALLADPENLARLKTAFPFDGADLISFLFFIL